MNLIQFRSSSKYVQEKIVKYNGVFLFERKALGVMVFLYQIDNFYVEVFFDNETAQVTFIKSFQDMDQIDAYLDKVDITPLLSILM